MQKFSCESIGTHLTIEIDTEKSCTDIFQEIKKRLDDFEKRFSRFRDDNWLAELNEKKSAEMDDDAKNMLTFALEMAKKTDGYFDPTIGTCLESLGYGRKKGAIDRECNFRNVEISENRVWLKNGSELEFGGVGKGYLLDVITKILDPYERFLINFGGDISACGSYKVGLESPLSENEIIGTLMLENAFLACSAGTKRKWGNYHHLIDPHTRKPTNDVIASYIEGEKGIIVDSYATTLCVMPWNLAIQTLENTRKIEGVLVRSDGTLFRSSHSRAEVFMEG